MKTKLTIVLFLLLLSLILCIGIYKCYEDEISSVTYDSPNYIAHAGGEIDGNVYTNCKEAVEQSIKRGIKYIELDLRLTSDSVLVAVHTWADYNRMTNNKCKNHVPTFNEFKQSKLLGKYTPLGYKDIDSILVVNPEIILVTDKISDRLILDKYLGKHKKRIMVECFTFEDYYYFMDNGYLLSMCAMSLKRQLYYYLLRKFQKKITRYNACVTNVNEHQKFHSGLKFVYTASNIREADELFLKYPDIKFVYVDNLDCKTTTGSD